MVEREQLDLTSEGPAEDRLITLPQRDYSPPAAMLAQDAYRVETIRERQRGRIAFSLILLLLLAVLSTVLLPVFFGFLGFELQELTGVLQAVGSTILTPIVGLIGAVIGFYFGGARAGAQVPPRPPTEGDGR